MCVHVLVCLLCVRVRTRLAPAANPAGRLWHDASLGTRKSPQCLHSGSLHLSLSHTRTQTLCLLKYFWLAEVVSSRSLFYFVSNFRVWGSCLALPSSPSFCSAFIKHSARAAVTRRRLLFIVTHPEAKFLLYFVHCHFRSSQS